MGRRPFAGRPPLAGGKPPGVGGQSQDPGAEYDGTEENLLESPILMQQICLTVLFFIHEFGSFPSLQSGFPVR